MQFGYLLICDTIRHSDDPFLHTTEDAHILPLDEYSMRATAVNSHRKDYSMGSHYRLCMAQPHLLLYIVLNYLIDGFNN